MTPARSPRRARYRLPDLEIGHLNTFPTRKERT